MTGHLLLSPKGQKGSLWTKTQRGQLSEQPRQEQCPLRDTAACGALTAEKRCPTQGPSLLSCPAKSQKKTQVALMSMQNAFQSWEMI